MRPLNQKFTPFLTAILLFMAVFCAPAVLSAQSDANVEELDALFEQLLVPVDGNWEDVEKRIQKIWSASGSDAMDLLLERGRQAMEAGDYPKAIEHLTALTDHAPGFAEGWNARATAFFLMEEYGLSLADIQTTLVLNPRHFGAMSGLGMIMEQLDEPQYALKAFRAAGAVHPFRPDLQEAIERLEEKTEGTSL
jgi:tetratricopeptide (TPR) repeat protein